MFLISGLEALAKIANGLQNGDNNIVGELIEKKLEDMGKELVLGAIGGEALAPVARIDRALSTGGKSEFDRLRQQWLNYITPAPLPGSGLVKKFQHQLNKGVIAASRPQGHWKWSSSRQEWLDMNWRHNWMSQPRDLHGRWIPGRLNHPYISRKARRVRAARRKAVRAAVRRGFHHGS